MRRQLLYTDRYFDVVGVPGGSFLASRPAVAVLALDGEAWWFVEEPAPAMGGTAVVAVTGVVEPDEPVIDAADRELREELGQAAARIVHLGVMRPWVKYLDLTVDVCLAIGLTPDESGAVGDEAVAPIPVRFTPAEFEAALIDGTVIDGMTIAAVAMARAWLDTNVA